MAVSRCHKALDGVSNQKHMRWGGEERKMAGRSHGGSSRDKPSCKDDEDTGAEKR